MPTPSSTRKFLEDCGLVLADIPAGRYRVGLSRRNRHPLLTIAPQTILYGQPAPTATRAQWVRCKAFAITTEPLRLSHWEKMAETLALPVALETIRASLPPQAPVVTAAPPPSLQQASSFSQDKVLPLPYRVEHQWEADPVIELPFAAATQVAQMVGATVPRWDEWEIATRGPQGFLYPWGDVVDVKQLALERQDYSTDSESEMGFYCYDKEVYFFHSFGPYRDQPSPFGLRGLARCGREWNLCHRGEPLADEDHMLRSLCDLGAMAGMHPGLNPHLWDAHKWGRERETFSGPVLPCYASEKVMNGLYAAAGFRFVLGEITP